MMNIFSSFYQLILLLLLAPLAAGLVKFFKARFQGRKGASPFLPYFTLLTLLKKEMVISDSTSWVFRLAPFVVFGSALFLILLLPLITLVGGFSEYSNFVIVAGVLMLTAVFLVFGGMESASAFGGMGAAREMAIASLVEPTMILIFAAMAINSTTSQISGMLSQLNIFEQPFMLFSLLALVLLALAENARYPVDNPATHLELTMVHEAMVLEYSGPYLALMEYASFLKLSLFSVLLVNFIYPVGLLSATSTAFAYLIAPFFLILKILIMMFLLAFLESAIVKMRFYRVHEFLAVAFFLSLGGVILTLVTTII
ncbi:MAG TPA: NADH-quinone oxidoreductase subunit H [Patescibacteria group bacterium]|nr:NADH-quinone oxidoreductase subunit H [Patescibacteria group bacterium]